MQKTSIVMASLSDEFEYMKESIESIRRFTEKETFELIVVESGGSLETKLWLAEQTDVRSLFFENELTLGQAWNQGVQVAVGESVLFMHADTLVTPNWLSSLVQSLDQNEQLGAVGPLTNGADDDQAENNHFASMEEMLSFAIEVNKEAILENRLILSDFCLIMKRTAIDTVGIFDEQLQGKTMIADFCLRMKQAGWSLGLCRHVFVHHYGIHEISEEKAYKDQFFGKWGFSFEETKIQDKVLKLIKRSSEDVFNILILGTGIGATSLKIKQLFPLAEIYGCNSMHQSGVLSSFIPCELIEFSSLEEYDFEYIILNPGMNLEEVLPVAVKLLTKQGKLITEMENANNFALVKNLMLGLGLEPDKKYWKISDIPGIFEKTGFQELDFDYVMNDIQEQDASFIKDLAEIVEQLPQEFEVSSFLITAFKTPRDEILYSLFADLLDNPEEEILSNIFRNSTTQILSSLERYEGPAISILNYLGISNFERKQLDNVLPYLTKAYELDPLSSVTLINLATVMFAIGEDEAALEWLNQLEEKNEQIGKWIREIEHSIYMRKVAENKVKFLLRRIENDVERDEASDEMITLLKNGTISVQDIIHSVGIDIIHKTDTLNRVAVNCFSTGEYEFVIPLLEESYSLDSENEDTLFNLGYILYKFGAHQDALNFLTQISQPDRGIMDLQKEIEENIIK
ncbi:glycosyltransferase [Paenibacillus dokdonensis]|uniref:glycosyltransferase n=1 Tax=Paenibacillus dokdonensis TaxID=2567944 RepID=UPI0010A859D7|nr:glycosyltransferase [Paenibacillus dokdonensis]